MNQPATAPEAEPAKKPRMSLKAKKEAFADLTALIVYRMTNDQTYASSEGLDRLSQSLAMDIQASEAKKSG